MMGVKFQDFEFPELPKFIFRQLMIENENKAVYDSILHTYVLLFLGMWRSKISGRNKPLYILIVPMEIFPQSGIYFNPHQNLIML